MRYNFLTDEELLVAIRGLQLGQLAPNRAQILIAEKQAIARMSDVLVQRYEVKDTFPNIPTWSNAVAYRPAQEIETTVDGSAYTYTPPFERDPGSDVVRNYVWHADKFYRCLATNTGVTPGTDDTKWVEEDPRDQSVIAHMVAILIYRLCSRIPSRQVPQMWVDNYNEAKEWLAEIRDHLITPDLPKPLPVDTSVDSIPWGNTDKSTHYY